MCGRAAEPDAHHRRNSGRQLGSPPRHASRAGGAATANPGRDDPAPLRACPAPPSSRSVTARVRGCGAAPASPRESRDRHASLRTAREHRRSDCGCCVGGATGRFASSGVVRTARRCWGAGTTARSRAGATWVLGNKHIPPTYLRARGQRRDCWPACSTPTARSDGAASSSRDRRARWRDGCRAGRRASGTAAPARRSGPGSTVSTSPTCVTFSTDDDVFRLERKRLVHKERAAADSRRATGLRYIADVGRIAVVPVRCVQVDNATTSTWPAGR